MTILVTGGAGYIGGQTVLALLDRGETPVVLDDLSTGNRAAVPLKVPLVVGDVGDMELVSRVIREHRIDAILHFAAKIIVPESIADPLSYYLNNTVKTRALLEAAVRGNVRHFVFSSTAAVYGNPKHYARKRGSRPGAAFTVWDVKVDVGTDAPRCKRCLRSQSCDLDDTLMSLEPTQRTAWSIYTQCHTFD